MNYMKKFDKIFSRGGDDPRREFRKRDQGDSRRDGGFGGGDRERPQMHEATCSDCGKRCEVPFKPSNDRPIYCSQCFPNHGGGSSSDRPQRREYGRSDRPSFQDRQDRRMYDAICGKCGAKFQLPFSPRGDKPVYCNQCFSKPAGSSFGGGSIGGNSSSYPQYKEQFEMLNAKLDRILKALIPVAAEEKTKEKKEEIKKEAAASETKEKTDSPKKAVKKEKKAAVKKPADKKKKAKK